MSISHTKTDKPLISFRRINVIYHVASNLIVERHETLTQCDESLASHYRKLHPSHPNDRLMTQISIPWRTPLEVIIGSPVSTWCSPRPSLSIH